MVFGCHVRTYATLPTAAAAVATTACRADTLLASRRLQLPGPPSILMFMSCLDAACYAADSKFETGWQAGHTCGAKKPDAAAAISVASDRSC